MPVLGFMKNLVKPDPIFGLMDFIRFFDSRVTGYKSPEERMKFFNMLWWKKNIYKIKILLLKSHFYHVVNLSQFLHNKK
jgi:hypothetical protein